MSTYSPPYSTFALNGANISVNNQGAHHQDNMRLRIDGDYLTILDGSEAICRGVLADYTGLTGGTLAAKMDYFSSTYTASAGAATLVGSLPDTSTGDIATIAALLQHQEYYIKAGLNAKYSPVNRHGINDDVDAAEDIAIQGGDYTFSSSAVAMYISSSSGGDNVDITVQGLDASWNEVEETVTLAGTTKTRIGATQTFLRINRAYSNNTTPLAGDVYIYEDDTTTTPGVPDTATKIRAKIRTGDEITQQAIYSVPANKTLYIEEAWATISRGGGAGAVNADMGLYIRPLNANFRILFPFNITESSSVFKEYRNGLKIKPQTDVKIRCRAISAANSIVNAGFDGFLYDMS